MSNNIITIFNNLIATQPNLYNESTTHVRKRISSASFKLFQAISSLKITTQVTVFFSKNILSLPKNSHKSAMSLTIVGHLLCQKTIHINLKSKSLAKHSV
jgi:hypothetical protein